MLIYVVHLHGHFDCYKRADSYSVVLKAFNNKEEACEYAIKNTEINDCNIIDIESDNNKQNKYLDYIKDEKKSFKERYEFLINNEYDIFGKGEFTMKPSCNICYVTELVV